MIPTRQKKMTTTTKEPLCQFEHEPEQDEGFWETVIFFAAVALTYATGYSNGVKEATAFLCFASLAALCWGWLFQAHIPMDNDKGL